MILMYILCLYGVGNTTHLECRAGSVGGVLHYLHRLFEHDPERGHGSIALEATVILTADLTRVCVDYLQRANINNVAELGKNRLFSG